MNLLNLFNGQPHKQDVSAVKYKKLVDQQLVDKLISSLQLSCKSKNKIMVGVSENTNSLVAGRLLKLALGESVIAMVLDLGRPQTNTLVESCKRLGLQTYVLNRAAAYQTETAAFGKDPKHYQRFISYHLLIQADLMKAVVVDTVDKSDRLLQIRPEGFYGHSMPFYSLYKSELYDLASLLQVPTDNLQTYCGLTYDKVDPVLYLLTEKQLKPEDISEQFGIDLSWLKKLKFHIDKQLFATTVSQLII